MSNVKMDANNLSSVEVWLQALGLLFRACEPLIFDCIISSKERADIISNIEKHTHYCESVKRAIDSGIRPETWDEWNSEVEDCDVVLESVDRRDFGDILTKIFSI